MIRLFVALDLPDALRQRLALMGGGVPGARWQRPEQMHLTLRFIGEVEPPLFADICAALAGVTGAPFTTRLTGIGQFGDRKPRAIWAGVERVEPLLRLQHKIEHALQRIGLAPEGRRYTPHVTLARLRNAPREAVATFCQAHNLFGSEPFPVTCFHLYSSHLSSEGSRYLIEESFPLAATALSLAAPRHIDDPD